MNQKAFGKLVKALRKEHRDKDDNFWTQHALAEKAQLSPRTIGRIENGTLQKLEQALLVKLADTLLLTSGERREFFLAASGIEHQQMCGQPTM